LEFVDDTQTWLREYHSRSIVETGELDAEETVRRAAEKKLLDRKATELLARVVVYNIHELVYLKYANGVDIEINPVPNRVTLMNWMAN